MAIKIPIRTVYDSSDNAIGLSEFQSGDAVGSAHGGTGLTSLGSAGQVLQVNSGGNGFEFGDKTAVNLDPYLKVANANINFVTKATALTTNNAIINLINDRLQVANANVSFVTKAVALSSNTTLKNLIDDRMQVANVSTLVTNEVNALIDSAPGALNTLNELAAALGDDANFSTTITNNLATKASNTYVNAQIGASNTNIRSYADTTFETKAVALASNNALLNLINDRAQVANVASLAALANTNTRLDILEAGGALATNTYIVANYLQKTSTSSQSTQAEVRVDSTSDTTGVHINDGSIEIFANSGTPAYVDFYCEVSNAHRTRLKSAAHTDYSGNIELILPVTNGVIATQEYAASNSYVNTTFETKAVALASNTAMKNLVDDRLQVANAAILYETKAVALAANNTQNNLINDRLQVANAAVAYVTKSTALTSNNNLLSLINDRIQVANVASSIRPSVFTVTSNTSIDATYHNDAVIINSSDTVVLTITASGNLTAGDTFKFYPVGDGDIRIDLNTNDSFLGTTLSTTTISAFSDAQISTLQNSQINGASNRDFVTTGLYTKVELLYTGSGNFVLTK